MSGSGSGSPATAGVPIDDAVYRLTFLELTKFVRQEAEIPSTGPTTVVNQTGELKRIVDWTASAWEDIQNKHQNWRWMRRAFTFNTVASSGSYAPTYVSDVDAGTSITRFGHWWAHDEYDPYLAYLQSSGVGSQYRLIYLPWDTFKQIYRFGTQTASQPVHVSVDHHNNIHLGPAPSAVYVVTGDFNRSLQVLTVDADSPEMPTQFHKLVGYYAMWKYGANSVAAEIVSRSQMEAARLMSALERHQLPMISLGGPLL